MAQIQEEIQERNPGDSWNENPQIQEEIQETPG